MNTGKKLISAALALMLMLTLVVGWSATAAAEGAATNVNRFNVVLVVDKSGSLSNLSGTGTDQLGLRFDALKLFLGLLTESGNNVGAIVFDEEIRYDSGLIPMNSMEEKKALVREIESFSTTYDTDIGNAMLRATEILSGMQEKNGLPCMILLFSDGKTDFSTGNRYGLLPRSLEKARTALQTAKEQGIQINGILLNVNGSAEGGDLEFRLYTEGTGGSFEEITSPESLTGAFRHFYSIINNTEYTGSEIIAFSENGEAETYFTVPSFGVEEVNVVVEHEAPDPDSREGGAMDIQISGPDGEIFSIPGHEIVSSRYTLVKIPEPMMGNWKVRLKGAPNDTVDITMVYNASMSAMLSCENEPEEYAAHTLYRFRVDVTDSAAPVLTQENLATLSATLEIMDRSDGTVRSYPMELLDGAFVCETSFGKGGSYAVSALVGAGGLEVRSNAVEATVNIRPLMATVSSVSDMLSVGRFHDDCWEVNLGELFGIGKNGDAAFTLSDDYNGELTVDRGVLQARFKGEDYADFTVRAEDDMGQSAEIPFRFTIPAVSTSTQRVYDMLLFGGFAEDCWEADLYELFIDPKGCAMEFELSDDQNGAVTCENGMLRVRPQSKEPLSFTVTATDIFAHSSELPFEMEIPAAVAKANIVKDMLKYGKFQGNDWAADISGLFQDPKERELRLTLSDDLDGALTLEDSTLHMNLERLKSADFSVIATDMLGLETELPFSLAIPAPTLLTNGISETVKTGLFQEKTWERRLDTLFRDPKGTKMTYTLSDDFGGAVKIEDNRVQAVCKGLKKADFTVKATDEYGISAEMPITLTERNMTLVYGLWTLAALALIGFLVWLFFFLRERYW